MKLILVLTVAFVLAAGSSFAATSNCIRYSVENDGLWGGLEQSEASSPNADEIAPQFNSPNPPDEAGVAGPPITSDYYFTIETDDVTGEVIAFTNLFGSNFLAYEYGGWNTEDSEPFDASEQIFKHGVAYNISDIAYDGYVALGGVIAEPGHGIWFRSYRPPYYDNPYTFVFDCGIIEINFNGSEGAVLFGPLPELTESYVFHAVPIPASMWLLMSGFIGVFGLRKRIKKG